MNTFSVAGVNAEPGRSVYIKRLMQTTMDDPTATATVTVTAQPDNPYDRNALEVKVNEKAVGFIARKDQTRAVPYLQHGTAKASILDWGVGHEGNLYVIIGL